MRPPSSGAPMNPTVEMICACHEPHPFGSGVDQPRKISSRDNAKTARTAPHSDQASRAAVRGLILLTTPPLWEGSRFSVLAAIPRCLWFVAPYYAATVSQALRQPLRGRSSEKIL